MRDERGERSESDTVDSFNACQGRCTDISDVCPDAITGGAGADNLTGGAGADQFVQGTADSVGSTGGTFAVAGSIAPNDSLRFFNGLDVITDFVAGPAGDALDIQAGTPVTAIGVAVGGLGDGTNYFLSGNFNAGTFSITADGAGADTLIVQGYSGAGTNLTTNKSAVLLVGVDSDDLVAGNFV